MGKQRAEITGQHNRVVSDDSIFKVSKEIIVKFIEVGRLTPANFDDIFKRVYSSNRETVRSGDNL